MIPFLLIFIGLIALVAGAELLVRGATKLAAAAGISSLVVGLTVVAFGTSAPELAVSVASTLAGQSDIAVGNVVGSNIFNVLFILGLSALIIPLVVHQKLVRFDVPLMILISVVVWVFALDNQIAQWEGIVLFLGLIAYTAWCVIVGRRESKAVRQEYDDAFPTEEAGPPPSAAQRMAHLGWQLLLVAGGLVLLVLGANWLVSGATDLARGAGVSELVIGLTIVAGGTSLPEVATSIVAAIRGERDIAVGNVVGSNIFNILGVLGLSAAVLPGGVAVAEQALQFDLPVMVLVAAACLPVFFTGHVIARWEGLLFFGYYVAYTTALVLIATSSDAFPLFQMLIFGFAAPLTIVTLLVGLTRSLDVWRWQNSRQWFSSEGNQTPRVVVIGGGFGGLTAVQRLAGAKARITLIDRRNFHLFQPLLYQVATGSLSPANIAAPLRNLLRRQWNAEVRLGEVAEIDLPARQVRLSDGGRLGFDYLVVAAGVRHSYFGHPEWEAAAPGLKTVEDATKIRRRILNAFEAAETEQDAERRSQLLTFVIVGGGPTGVELAGSLAEIAQRTLEFEFRSINPSDARIILLEAADRILTMYPPQLSAKAQASLERLGVSVRCSTKVLNVSDGEVTIASDAGEETLRVPTILWAAGVAASPLARALAEQAGVETDRLGRVPVQADLSLAGYPHVFVIGDMADCRTSDGRPVPGIAPVAIQQGKYVAKAIRARLAAAAPATGTGTTTGTATRPPQPLAPFHYVHQGSLATIGRSAAVAQLGWLKISGFPAWLLWLLIHVAKLSAFENRILVLVQWSWSFFTFGRSARLITGSDRRAKPSLAPEVESTP